MKSKKYIPFILLIFFAITLLGLLFYILKIDYEKDELLFKNSNHTSVITIYADVSGFSGKDLKNYRPKVREEVCFSEYENKWVDIEDVPTVLINAFLCTEDRNFYQHNGVNIPRTIKALLNYLTKSEKRFGASTITQQVIKNISGDNELSIKRKIDEIFRAYALERKHSKNEILEMYLNIIPMGNRLIGVSSAAKTYFGKDVSELSISECATIVAITNAPSKFHPVRHPKETKEKRDVILSTMLRCCYITEEEYEEAIKEDIITVSEAKNDTSTISWFSETVIEQVKQDLIEKGMTPQAVSFLLSNGGLKIYSTEDIVATDALNHVFYSDETQEKIEENQLDFAMIIVNNDTGYLSAVLGNGAIKKGNRLLNLATDTPHTPGSSLKPLALYAPLLNQNKIHWGTTLDDVPLEFIKEGNEYRLYPQNLPMRYDGLTTIRDALKFSKNTIAIRLYQMLGNEEIYSHLVNDFHFKHIVRYKQLSDGTKLTDLAKSPLALGQLSYGATLKELTDAYTAFPREGVFSESKGYIAVYDKDNNLLLENKSPEKRVYKKETARIMNQLLSEVVDGGTAKNIQLKESIDTAGKTGTSGDDKDRLFIGYTPYYTAGIWCAKTAPEKSIGKVSVSHLNLWDEVMKQLHQEKISKMGISSFSTGGLIKCQYCQDSGLLPCESCKLDLRGDRISEGYFTVDNMPRQACQSHFRVLYDSLCNAIATEGCVSDDCVKLVSLVRLPKRSFPTEVIITDAEYMGMEISEDIKFPNDYEKPYFYYALPEGIFVGRSKQKKQKNSICYFHIE